MIVDTVSMVVIIAIAIFANSFICLGIGVKVGKISTKREINKLCKLHEAEIKKVIDRSYLNGFDDGIKYQPRPMR